MGVSASCSSLLLPSPEDRDAGVGVGGEDADRVVAGGGKVLPPAAEVALPAALEWKLPHHPAAPRGEALSFVSLLR